ncbi:MAG: efflux RND transporter periplasmic adaptor subunit [Candidatus Gracilibacteria bacterium]|jgi:RND family efflux transporter MFP subunit
MAVKDFLKKKVTLAVIGVTLLVILGIVWMNGGSNATAAQFTVAEKKDLKQEVSVTGTVNPVQDVEMAFETGGKIQNIYVESGDSVYRGQILAEIENDNLRSQVSRASAGVRAENARFMQYQAAYDAEASRLADLRNGASQEELQVYETAVSNAGAALTNARDTLTNAEDKANSDLENLYGGVLDVLQDAYFYADDAVRLQTDPLFSNDYGDPELVFTVTDYASEQGAEKGRILSEKALNDFKDEIDALPLDPILSDGPVLEAALESALTHLNTVRDFLDFTSETLNHSAGLTDSTLATYKTAINAARLNVNTSIESVNNKNQAVATQKITNTVALQTATTALNSAENSLATAEANLTLEEAGATPEAIAEEEANLAGAKANLEMQEAGVSEANASLAEYTANLNKTIIYAPFDGVITKQDGKEGESASALTPIISMMSTGAYEVEAFVAEADIAKVATGMSAEITLDAYGSDTVFAAKVVFVEIGETVIDGVSTYKIKLYFDEENDKIRSGMTANVDISGEVKTGVIAIPQRSVIRKDGGKFVQVLLDDGSTKEVQVETGFRGSDGYIEITSGLIGGEKVLLYSE